jgi:hypothetical protein
MVPIINLAFTDIIFLISEIKEEMVVMADEVLLPGLSSH